MSGYLCSLLCILFTENYIRKNTFVGYTTYQNPEKLMCKTFKIHKNSSGNFRDSGFMGIPGNSRSRTPSGLNQTHD